MLLQTILFGTVYILIFSGYYTVTGFLSIAYPTTGFWSFVCFYTVYALGSLIAPYFISRVNFRILFLLSGISFVVFVGLASSQMFPLLMVGSAIGGVGNSFIWLIQGSWLSHNKVSMGLFYSLFNINMIIGNLLSVIVLTTGASVQIMMFSMIGVTSIGVSLIFFILPTSEKNQQNSIVIKTKEVFLSSKKCYLLILCMVYSSIGLNVTYQILPKLLFLSSENDQTKAIFNSVMYIIYGLTAMGASVLWTKLFSLNWKYLVIPYTILEILCLIIMLLLTKYTTIVYYWLIIGFLRGGIDYGINNLINITLSRFPENDIDNLFGLYRFIYATSYLVTAICVGYVPYEYILLICGIFCILSSISYFFFNFSLSKLEKEFDKSAITV